VSSKDEYSNRRTPEELTALTPELASKLQSRPVHDIAATRGQERATAAWTQLEKLDSAQRVRWLRNKWQSLLGNIVAGGKPRLVSVVAGAVVVELIGQSTLLVEPLTNLPNA
jgi:hypothetical protein